MSVPGPGTVAPITLVRQRPAGALQRWGDALRRHRRSVAAVQWTIVAFYTVLVVVPALLPMPAEDARLWNDLTLAAQFIFWGL